MGKTQEFNHVTGRYPASSQTEITIGDGVNSSGEYNAPSGVLDVTLANAIEDLEAGGGTIYLLNGNFSITANFIIERSNIKIVGAGYSTYLNTGDFYFKIYDPTPADVEKSIFESIRFHTTQGPAIVYGDIGGSNAVNSKLLSSYFEPESPWADPNTTTGIEALWKLDDNGPFASSVNTASYQGNEIGAFVAADGALGYASDKAQTFDGTNDVIWISNSSITAPTIPIPENSTQAFTIEAWIYPTVTGDIDSIYTQCGRHPTSGPYGLRFTKQSDETLSLRIESSGDNYIEAETITTIISNKWTYVVATYDGSVSETGLKIYINGLEADVITSNAGTFTGAWTGTTVAAIGARYNTNIITSAAAANIINYISIWTGLIDNVVIWRSELTAAQVRDRYLQLIQLDIFKESTTSTVLTNNNISTTKFSGL